MKTTLREAFYLVNRGNVVFVWSPTKISHSKIWNGNCQLPPFTCLQYFRNIRIATINNQPFPGLHLHQRRLLGSSRLQAVRDVHCLIDGTFVMLMLWDFWKRMISLKWPWPRFVLFNVKDGNFVGVIQIPNHLERNKGHLLLSKNRIPIFSTKS